MDIQTKSIDKKIYKQTVQAGAGGHFQLTGMRGGGMIKPANKFLLETRYELACGAIRDSVNFLIA